jgi:TolA-binding protein
MEEMELNRLADLMDELHFGMKEMRDKQKETNSRLGKLEDQLSKTNLAIGELRVSVMRLADQMGTVFQHEKRIDALEKVVFK